jgi:hypothetical protein
VCVCVCIHTYGYKYTYVCYVQYMYIPIYICTYVYIGITWNVWSPPFLKSPLANGCARSAIRRRRRKRDLRWRKRHLFSKSLLCRGWIPQNVLGHSSLRISAGFRPKSATTKKSYIVNVLVYWGLRISAGFRPKTANAVPVARAAKKLVWIFFCRLKVLYT